jgi:hypothetical protein
MYRNVVKDLCRGCQGAVNQLAKSLFARAHVLTRDTTSRSPKVWKRKKYTHSEAFYKKRGLKCPK